MKAIIFWLGALVLVAAFTAPAQAHSCYGCSPPPLNAFTPPCYSPSWGGGFYGSFGYGLPCEPFQGIRPPGSMGMGFSVHPFARSPRDYFMMDP